MSRRIAQCSRCEADLEPGDLRCTICSLAVPADSHSTVHTALEIQRCTSCGVAMSYDVRHRAPACPFCGSVIELEIIKDPMEQAEGHLPFKVRREDAHKALSKWISSLGWFRPSDLNDGAQIESMKKLYFAAWICDGQARVSWAADSTSDSKKSRWAPHAGQFDFSYDQLLIPASKGLTFEEVSAMASTYNLETSVGERVEDEKALVECFDMQRSVARQRVMNALQATAHAEVVGKYLPSGSHRNLAVELLLRALKTRRLAFPAWVLAYRYRNTLYRVVISGQNPDRVLGDAPYSPWKILGAVAGGFAALVLLAVLISAFS